jgi:uncharacterized membrane protein
MNKVLVAVFDSENNARSAVAALKGLADADTIRLNASAIVSKSPGGTVTVSRTGEPVPQGTLGATAVGVLVGMLAGGVGLAVGATAGLILGGIADTFYLEVGRGFLADVERTLTPGKAALVAQVYEEDREAVDTRIAECGGVAFRQPVDEVMDAEYANATAAFSRALKQTKS